MISFRNRENFQKKIFSAFSIIICLCMVCGLVWAAQMTANAEEHTDHCVCGSTTDVGDHTHINVTWTAWDGMSAIEYTDNTAYVYLTKGATPSSAIEVTDGNTLNLCLNGNTLSRSATVLDVKGDATLNICDCKGNGKIESSSGGAIQVTTVNSSNARTTLNLYGGKVRSDAVLDSGTIVLYNNDHENEQTVAVFNMYGGEVCNNDSAVYASYAGIGSGCYNINIYGGKVTCEGGCGFDFNNNKNVTMQVSGGTITSGNWGINLCSGNTLTLSGNPRLEDKKYYSDSAGIYLPQGASFTVKDDFKGNASVMQALGRGASAKGVIATPEAGESLSGKAQYFTSAEEGYFVECNTNGNLQLTACTITGQPTANNNYTVTASGGTDANKVEYQWYSATKGNVAVTDKNAAKGSDSGYRGDYWNEWYTTVNPKSSEEVAWDAFTLHMAEDDVLTVRYQASDYDNSGYYGSFKSFKLTKDNKTVEGKRDDGSYNTTYTFTAPSEGAYTLTATATPGSYKSSDGIRYNLSCGFSATVTAYVAGTELSGKTAAKLDTTELNGKKYLCAVTWEGKTTLYSSAVDIAEHTHSYQYTANENVITENCSCGHIETATLELDSDAPRVYTGSEIMPLEIIYSDGWAGDKNITITYSNNVNAGKATGSITHKNIEAEKEFTVNNASLTNVKVEQTGTLTYNGTAQKATVSESASAVNSQPIKFTYSEAENGTYMENVPTFTNAEAYTVYYKASAPNHTDATGTFKVEVGKAPVTVKAKDGSKTYGENDPEFTWDITSGTRYLSDSLNVNIARKSGEGVGAYDIIASESLRANPNYDVTFVNGKFTIEKATLTVSAEDKTINYGDSAPVYTVTYAGFKNGDDKAKLSGTLAFDCDYQQFSNRGTYSITPKGYQSDNYDFNYENGELTVSPKKITVTINEKTSVYGNELQALTADNDNGIVNGDANVYELSTTASKKANVGKYDITGKGLDNNYDITFVNGAEAYEITRRSLTVSVVVANKKYDGKNTAVISGTPTLNGVVSGETVTLTNGVPTFASVKVGNGININFTNFSITGNAEKNYTLTQPSGITANIEAYNATGTEYRTTTGEWTNQDFVVTASSGWKLSLTNTADGDWVDSLTETAESDNGEMTFYVKNTTTGIISEVITKSYKIDKTAPVISGADSDKTYCAAVTLSITDENLATVSLNNNTVALTNGELTINPAEGAQTVVATDKAGNSTNITVTVNDGHTWDTGVVTTEPTYTQEGMRTYTCTVCSATKTESIAKLPSGGGSVSKPNTGSDNVVNKSEDKTAGTAATTTATVKPSAATTTADGKKTATTSVDDTTAGKIIDKAVTNKSTEVMVNTSTKEALTEATAGAVTEIALPEKTVQELSEKTEASVTIKSDAAEVTLNKKAVDGLAAQAGDDGYVKLVVETVKQEPKLMQVDLKLVTSKGTVSDFRGGNVSVTVKLNDSLATKELTCVYISDGGIYHKVNGTKNTNGTYTFITGHFSSYAIMALDEANEVIFEQTAKAKELAGKIQIKARSVKTKKGNIKVTLKITKGAASFKALKDMGYTLKYQYYRSTAMKKNYKAKFETLGKPYTNTDAKKGTRYYYKARIVVYDEEGSLVTKTDLKKCWYATRIR